MIKMLFCLLFLSSCEDYHEITFKPGLNFITEPIIIKNDHTKIDGKGKVRLIGGIKLGNARKVKDENVLSRLDESVREKIYQIDLSEFGITNFLPFDEIGYNITTSSSHNNLYIDQQQMNLAHYPRFGKYISPSDPGPYPVNLKNGVQFNDSRIFTWKFHPNIMAWGYWSGYTGLYRKVSKIDNNNHKVYLVNSQTADKWAKVVFYNIFEELRYPGDFYIDQDTKILYFYPFDKITSKSEIILSNFNNTIIAAKSITDIVIKDISIECSAGNALGFYNCDNVLIENCHLFNLGLNGISFSSTNDFTVKNCKIHNVMHFGVDIRNAGDRKTLMNSNSIVYNTEVYWFCNMSRDGMTQAFRIDGVGVTISHCYIHHGPSQGIYYDGNNMLFEYNELAYLLNSPYPQSAIYAGVDYTTRNNTIKYNYIHDLYEEGMEHFGIYMDDVESGAIITHNIVVNSDRSIALGGGRDYYVRNNIIVNGRIGIWVDARAAAQADFFHPILRPKFYKIRGDPKIRGNLPPYITSYPNLSVIDNYYKNNTVEIPKIPPSAYIFDNCHIYTKSNLTLLQTKVDGKSTMGEVYVNNYINATEEDFADFKNGDYSIKKGSRLHKLGLDPVNQKEMGLKDKNSKNIVVPIIVTIIVIIVIGVIIGLIYFKIKKDKAAERSISEKNFEV
ncbi:hypothetical protein TVAG_178740 [Trichomonas vaginalis G3]|uniref:Right handed beta helix domain-containing protein n=1 Tax=Trichomonas vaginalis (strain ATCC PRA-98 / G3) TaxID=412133 RepID=A2DIM6_TRIV3|nr:secreted protein-related family [Trichomonas vaginalis G3]EAY19830.1 hypothetical protein TVAG_178740 [Trichomonas vaginalis G3]KAI5524033.1 secreted protein-related family [Trichomonas vaginalis G3]|eukprot:XP_001580816.1 hypothetical protein [Trichomonas vaginalis G3]